MVKVALRHYEVLAMLGPQFEALSPTYTLDQDEVPLPEYVIPRLDSFLDDEDNQAARGIKDIKDLAKDNINGLASEERQELEV